MTLKTLVWLGCELNLAFEVYIAELSLLTPLPIRLTLWETAIYISAHQYTCVCVRACVRVHARMCVYVCMCMCVCLCACVCVVCMWVDCVYAGIYVCAFTALHVFSTCLCPLKLCTTHTGVLLCWCCETSL